MYILVVYFSIKANMTFFFAAIQMGRPSKVRYNHDTSCHNEIEKKRIHLDSSGDSGNSSTHSSPILRIPDHFQPCNDFRSLLQYDMNLSGGNNFAGLATKANGEIIFGSLDFLQPPFPQIAVSSCSLPIYQPHINISATSYHLGDSKQPHALHQTQLLHQPLQHSTVLHPQQRLNIPSSDLWSPQSNKFDVKSVRDCINYIPELGLTEEPPLELTRVMPVEMPVSREVLNIGDGERSLAILSTLNSLQLPEITIASSSHWHTNSTIDNDLRSILKAEKEKALQLCGSELNIHHGLLSDWHVESEGNLSPKLESGIGLSEIMGERDSESDKSVLTSFAGSVLQVKIDSLEAPPASNDAATIVQFKDNYWTDTTLPIEDIFLSEEHMKIVQDILAAYNRFVDTGSNINQQLRREFDVSYNSTCIALLIVFIVIAFCVIQLFKTCEFIFRIYELKVFLKVKRWRNYTPEFISCILYLQLPIVKVYQVNDSYLLLPIILILLAS